ncbi:MAG: Omp28-related outer membrane protein [Bacteroidetes bacterium]|nr:Omp28-related outer membrane protein [Bacteroidota bacterium]
MKNNLLKTIVMVLTASTLLFFGCSKEETKSTSDNNKPVVEVFSTSKQALFLYFTGSECNPCGSVGIPNYNSVVGDLNLKDKVLGVCVHCNAPAPDKLYDAVVGGDLLNLIVVNNSYSAPTFLLLPNASMSGSGSNSASQVTTQINTFSYNPAVASVNATVTLNGSVFNVKTRTKFFSADSGTYQVSVWVLEDSISFHQVVNGAMVNPYIHNEVLRGRFSSASFGDAIKIGKVDKDTLIEKTFLGAIPAINSSIPEKNWNKKNLSAVVTIWKKNKVGTTTTYEVMNITKVKLPVAP